MNISIHQTGIIIIPYGTNINAIKSAINDYRVKNGMAPIELAKSHH